MNQNALEMLAAAANDVIGNHENATPKTFATWKETRHDDDFELHSTIAYLRSEGHEVDESLLSAYAELHLNHSPLLLAGMPDITPWLICLDRVFDDYDSFAPLRVEPRFIEIFTFTTPAFSNDRKLAFLEVWTEDGRYAQMGFWWWLQMRSTGGVWSVDWKNMHAIS